MELNKKGTVSNRFVELYNFAKEENENDDSRPYKFSNIFKYVDIDYDYEEENISYNDCILLININEIYKKGEIFEIIQFNIMDGNIILFKTYDKKSEPYNLFTKNDN